MSSAQRRDAESRDFVGHESAMGSAESRRILRLLLVGERTHEPHVARVAMEPLNGGPPAPACFPRVQRVTTERRMGTSPASGATTSSD